MCSKLPLEVLREVFQLSETESNAVNMRVCKAWLKIVEPIFWAHVHSPFHLDQLLGTLAQSRWWHDDDLRYGDIREKFDWTNFLRICRMIHSLTITTGSNYSTLGVLELIAVARPILDLTPNLQVLICDLELSRCGIPGDVLAITTIFAHPRLKKLVINVNIIEFDLGACYIPFLRLSNLVHFELTAYYEATSREDSEALLDLGLLVNLKSVSLPHFYATAALIEALSRLPSLEQITSTDFLDDDPHGRAVHGPAQKVGVEIFDRGCFPLLKTMTLAGNLVTLESILRQAHFPRTITSLALEVYADYEEQEMAHDCLGAVAQVCPMLTSLSVLDGRWPVDKSWGLSYEHMKDAFSSRLTTLELAFPSSNFLPDEEIEIFAHTIPYIETLILNKDPRDVTRHHPFSILQVFARHCRKLRRLGIFFETATAENLDDKDIVPFAVLEVLDVGASPLIEEHVQAVSMHLVQLLPLVPFSGNEPPLIYIPDIEDPSADPWRLVSSTLLVLRKMLEAGKLGTRIMP